MRIDKYIILLCVILILIFAGCDKHINNITYDKNNIPTKKVINMIRIPQNDNYSCATTSVAMIITYYQKLKQPLNKEVVWKVSKTDKEKILKYGNDINGLNRICDYYNYKHEFKQNMSFDDLRYYLSHNIPVVIFINFDKIHTHATVLNGYDINKKVFFVVDPSVEKNEMAEVFLENHWSAWLSNPKTESFRAGYLIFNK